MRPSLWCLCAAAVLSLACSGEELAYRYHAKSGVKVFDVAGMPDQEADEAEPDLGPEPDAEPECGPWGCTCEPDCWGLECGDDGCGGVCGACDPGMICSDEGLCESEPGGMFYPCLENDDCSSGWCVESEEGKVCTEHCVEDCPAGWICKMVEDWQDIAFICLPEDYCVPDCYGKECGSDGCGGTCGFCEQPQECVEGSCYCFGDCLGKECGDDGCGWSCGTCPGGTACKAGICKAGTCKDLPDWSPCDDGDPCTLDDWCKGDVCIGGAAVDCDDGNPCTDDTCDPDTGFCMSWAVEPGTECDDGDPCTLAEACIDGECIPQMVNLCDDDNPCTFDWCVEGECINDAQPGMPCEDSDACTVQDACEWWGDCAGLPVFCDDENPCTDDLCDPAIGCLHVASFGPCNDGNDCTVGDQCVDGFCLGQESSCDDGDPCTLDTCDPWWGCTFESAIGAACDDGDLCTVNDKCVSWGCMGSPKDCSDGNDCTDDQCDPAAGKCIHVNNESTCGGGDACTAEGLCQDGSCLPGPPVSCDDVNPCSKEWCELPVGCVYVDLPDCPAPFAGNTGTWELLAGGLETSHHALAALSDGTIYMIGGGYPGDQVYRFAPASNTWSKAKAMNVSRFGPAAAVVNDIVYVMGGGPADGFTDSVEAYDPKTDVWTYKSATYVPRSRPGAAVFGGQIWVFGGVTPGGAATSIEIFDPATNVWSLSEHEVPEAGEGMTAFALGDHIFVFVAHGTFAHPTVFALEPKTATWNALPGPWGWSVWGDEHTLAAGMGQTLAYLGATVWDEDPGLAWLNLGGEGSWVSGAATLDPERHRDGALIAAGGYIYAIGGDTSGPMAERYDPRFTLAITYPKLGQTVSGTFAVEGRADRTDFKQYTLEVKASAAPDSAYQVVKTGLVPVAAGTLAVWDSKTVASGQYKWRLTLTCGCPMPPAAVTHGFVVNNP